MPPVVTCADLLLDQFIAEVEDMAVLDLDKECRHRAYRGSFEQEFQILRRPFQRLLLNHRYVAARVVLYQPRRFGHTKRVPGAFGLLDPDTPNDQRG